MTRDRFDKITQYLHVNGNSKSVPIGHDGHDPLHQVRPIYDVVSSTCFKNYNAHQNQSVDEAMVSFPGRSGFRQYLPEKPTRYGIKVWCRADPHDGYLSEFQVYTGKAGGGREVGLTSRVVCNMANKIYGRNHIINLFTAQLLAKDTYYRGTARINRSGFPSLLLTEAQRSIRHQGDSVVIQNNQHTAVCWRDKKSIFFLSTADQATATDIVQRKQRDGSVKEISYPSVVTEYNKHMKWVDHSDQIRTACPSFRTSHKWWTYIFWYLFDVCIANAFLLMKQSTYHQLCSKTNRPIDRRQLDFRQNLSKLLIGKYI